MLYSQNLKLRVKTTTTSIWKILLKSSSSYLMTTDDILNLPSKRKKKNENTTEVSTVNDYNSILKIVKGTTLFQSMIHNLAD